MTCCGVLVVLTGGVGDVQLELSVGVGVWVLLRVSFFFSSEPSRGA
jgi:hypothetical protein